jgi:hypothetical protein
LQDFTRKSLRLKILPGHNPVPATQVLKNEYFMGRHEKNVGIDRFKQSPASSLPRAVKAESLKGSPSDVPPRFDSSMSG